LALSEQYQAFAKKNTVLDLYFAMARRSKEARCYSGNTQIVLYRHTKSKQFVQISQIFERFKTCNHRFPFLLLLRKARRLS
jgi:hypothetical protein